MAITHTKVVTVPDDGTSPVGTDEWNDDHTIGSNTINDTMISAHTTTKITVPHTNITGLATSATTDTTDASNITSGALPIGQLPTVTIAKGGSGAATQQAAINALTAVSGAANEYVLTKDTSSSNAVWKAASTVAAFDDLTDVTGGSATGTMLYKSSGDWIALTSSGHGGKTLQMNAGATAPEWVTASGGTSTTVDCLLIDNADTNTVVPTYSARTENSTSTPIQIYVQTIDSNNEGVYIRVKKNGTYTNVQIA